MEIYTKGISMFQINHCSSSRSYDKEPMAQWKVLGVASCNLAAVGSSHISNHKKKKKEQNLWTPDGADRFGR